jgi:hypothetical protein
MHRNDDILHLRLTGIFDPSTAQRLLDMIKKYGRHFSRIFIHTDSLNEVRPAGKALFVENLKQMGKPSTRLIFTGENATVLSS